MAVIPDMIATKICSIIVGATERFRLLADIDGTCGFR